MSIREQIAEQFDNCMGYWEGICVPDYREGKRAIDYADRVLKLIEEYGYISKEELEKLIDFMYDCYFIHYVPEDTFKYIKEKMLKK